MVRTPLYKAAETEMMRRIEDGEWAVGQRLPNEFVLADEFGVSQGTMRRALITLETAGYLDRKPGRGTLVARPDPASTGAAPAVAMPNLQEADGAPLAFEIHRATSGTRSASSQEHALFGVRRIATLDRLLKSGGRRVAIEEIAVPETVIPALDETAPVDLAACLAMHGVTVGRIENRMAAAMTTMTQSVTLSCDRHSPMFVLTRTAFDAAGQAVATQTLQVLADGVIYA